MPSATLRDACLWVKHIDCDITQRALLSLEPGSRIWLAVDGEPLLFERMRDGVDGRPVQGLKPVGGRGGVWQTRFQTEKSVKIDLDFVERPRVADVVGSVG